MDVCACVSMKASSQERFDHLKDQKGKMYLKEPHNINSCVTKAVFLLVTVSTARKHLPMAALCVACVSITHPHPLRHTKLFPRLLLCAGIVPSRRNSQKEKFLLVTFIALRQKQSRKICFSLSRLRS